MVWNNWIATCRIPKNLDTDLTPFTKISSKCILDLTVKYKTLKLLKDDIRENVGNLRFGKFSSPKTNQWIKKNWTSLKKKKTKKHFCSVKDNVKKKWEYTRQAGRKCLQKISDRKLIQNMQNVIKLNNKKTNNPIKK